MGRRTIRTAEKRAAFLRALREIGTVTGACEAAGIARQRVYEWREEDPSFAAEWDAVLEAVTDDLEHEAIRRAKEGSDTLLIFLLKANRPEKYRERVEFSGDPNRPMKLELSGVDVAAAQRLLASLTEGSDGGGN